MLTKIKDAHTPSSPGTCTDQAEASKLKHSVNALGTVVEGPAAKVWSVCRTMIWDDFGSLKVIESSV